MKFTTGLPANQSGPAAQKFRAQTGHWIVAIAISMIVIVAGTMAVNLQTREIEARQKIDLLMQGSAVRARLNRELNRVLYLTSGLSSYLAVRHNNMDRNEVETILLNMYQSAQHVVNLGIAVGYRVTYIYPVKGNDQVIGLYYPDVPEQWPAVKRIIDSGQPGLIGPVKLVQGGIGLIYRVPIFINGNYWGLLSSVIDAESLLTSALEDNSSDINSNNSSDITVAIRGKDGAGLRGAVFWGEAALFNDLEAQLVDIDVPGGKWVMAVRSTVAADPWALRLMQILVYLLAFTLGAGTLLLLNQRARMTQLAMFDPLTGLPNRLLADDRVSLALSGLRRDPERTCLLLFIDLDGFKLINDRFGHKAGDAALQGAAARLEDAVRETDTVSRWGGDEFIVFMENADRGKVGEIVEKIRRVVEMPINFGPHELKVGASIGSAYAPDDGDTLDELVRIADERMYAGKAARRDVGTAG